LNIGPDTTYGCSTIGDCDCNEGEPNCGYPTDSLKLGAEKLITFDEISSNSAVLTIPTDFYNGGGGPNFGVQIIGFYGVDQDYPSNVGCAPTPSIMASPNFVGDPSYFNIPGGFTGNFFFRYTSPNCSPLVIIYDQLDQAGNILAQQTSPATGSTCTCNCVSPCAGPYCDWTGIISIPFTGTAYSVGILNCGGGIGIDNVCFECIGPEDDNFKLHPKNSFNSTEHIKTDFFPPGKISNLNGGKKN